MTRSAPVALLTFLLARWSQISCGAPLQDRMMRNEKAASEQALQLMPDGMIQTETRLTKEQEHLTTQDEEGTPTQDEQDPESFCDYDFPWGNQNSNDCDSRSITAESDLSQDECIFAAEQAGAVTHHGNFDVDQDWQNVRPIGCFMFPCGNQKCYYHNEDLSTPRGQLTGIPVCRRYMYIEGTATAGAFVNDTRICNNADYSAGIINSDKCRNVAKCLGHETGADFTIGAKNGADELLHPQGCFVHAAERTAEGKEVVYFNPLTMGQAPTKPEGKPLCKVKQPQQVRG